MGSSVDRIGNILLDNDVIRNELYFKVMTIRSGKSGDFKAGNYLIPPNIEITDLISMIAQGDTIKEETTRVTIPEGFTIEQIAERLANNNVTSKDEFTELAFSWKEERWFLDGEFDEGHNLEGYLYPETYEFRIETPAEEVINRMLNRLEQKILPFKDEMLTHELSIHEIMTLASLIEREARHDADRPKIASVIYNRLDINMLLQIDASILYATGHKQTVTYADTRIDSPYNTYRYKGLPPTPIASPSIKSIEATLSPDTTDYLFYVADRLTGSHHFALTYAEHKENIEKYWRVN